MASLIISRGASFEISNKDFIYFQSLTRYLKLKKGIYGVEDQLKYLEINFKKQIDKPTILENDR